MCFVKLGCAHVFGVPKYVHVFVVLKYVHMFGRLKYVHVFGVLKYVHVFGVLKCVHMLCCMTVSTKNAISLSVGIHLQNPPYPQTQISRYLAVQIQIQILVQFEFVPSNLSFRIWWVSQA